MHVSSYITASTQQVGPVAATSIDAMDLPTQNANSHDRRGQQECTLVQSHTVKPSSQATVGSGCLHQPSTPPPTPLSLSLRSSCDNRPHLMPEISTSALPIFAMADLPITYSCREYRSSSIPPSPGRSTSAESCSPSSPPLPTPPPAPAPP